MKKNVSHDPFHRLIRRAKCKDYVVCPGFSDSNYTCMHGGGEYCGKYRVFEQGERKIFAPNLAIAN